MVWLRDVFFEPDKAGAAAEMIVAIATSTSAAILHILLAIGKSSHKPSIIPHKSSRATKSANFVLFLGFMENCEAS